MEKQIYADWLALVIFESLCDWKLVFSVWGLNDKVVTHVTYEIVAHWNINVTHLAQSSDASQTLLKDRFLSKTSLCTLSILTN